MGNQQSHATLVNKLQTRKGRLLGRDQNNKVPVPGTSTDSSSRVTPSGAQPIPPDLLPRGTPNLNGTNGLLDGSTIDQRQQSQVDSNIQQAMTSRQPQTVPCQYRTGKTLGSGTYAIVKEAVHIKTGEYYACKVINKKLMEGREHMVRNEIAVLKRVTSGHRNIVTLHDYFETAHNLYLVFDLCTGGELFDRICAKGQYFEADAAHLVRTIMRAVEYIHSCGVVHRDLKPENLLFRTKAEEADIMIADFGLSRIMEEEKFQLLHEVCGTPGYMAPEIFRKVGHGKPVDVWAMGVITYFLLCGYTPFDRDTQKEEMEAILKGDYKFEPEEYWAAVSPTAREFVSLCLTIDPANRPTATEALAHRWLASDEPHFVPDSMGAPTDLLPNVRKGFDARKTFRKAVLSVVAGRRFSAAASHDRHAHMSPSQRKLAKDVEDFKEGSELEKIDENLAVRRHDMSGDGNGNGNGNGNGSGSGENGGSELSPTTRKLAEATLTDRPSAAN